MSELRLNGPVVDDADAWIYDWFGEPCISPNGVHEFLENAGTQDLTLTINSMGGSVFAGSEIYTALKNYPGRVNIVVGGLAASIASVIAMAGDTVKISPLGQIMIHNASMLNYGDHKNMSKASEILFDTSESLASVYASKTGKSVEDMMALMEKESWFTADKAVEIGLADEVLFSDQSERTLVASSGGFMNKEKIAEFKAILAKKESSQEKSLTIEAVEQVVSRIIDQKLSDKTIKSQTSTEKSSGLGNYLYYLGGNK